MEFHRLFPTQYEVEVVDLAPESAYVFGRAGAHHSDDVNILVSTEGNRWTGVARAGASSLRGTLSGVFATPDAHKFCIVARGDAYLIDAAAPECAKFIDTAGPVMAARALAHEELLLLASPWTITALGAGGFRWRTGRLAIEGIRLDEVQGGWLAGVADPRDDEPRDFAVDLTTGSHRGGVPFD